MREIKFRAWDKEKKFMLYPDMECESDAHYTISTNSMLTDIVDAYIYTKDDFYMDRFPIMQYTGLKDSTGKEIYEGDIVKWEHMKEPPLVIMWDKKDAGFRADKADGTPDSWIDDKIIVIGNIHENPELLEELRSE